MPPRSTPPPKFGSFSPPNDSSTYRDLLLFEERLKTTAASLQRRKARYQLFLFQLLLVISFLLSEVFLPPQYSLVALGYRAALLRLHHIPGFDDCNPFVKEDESPLHPYVTSGLLFVSMTTLALFFASGMYSEKIAYANKYVPHTNRALRSFNMYLNVRKPPLRSKFSYWNPLPLLFPRTPLDPSSSTGNARSRSSSPSPSRDPKSRPRSQSTSRPIAPIPPATNPRGELIFSSRVDRSFRESYERYRAAFERKREEKERAARRGWWCGSGNGRWTAWLFGVGAPIGDGGGGASTPMLPATPSRTATRTSSRGRGTPRSGTPPSPSGVSGGNGGIMIKSRSRRGTPSTSPSRVDTPVPSLGDTPSSSRVMEDPPPLPSPSRRGSRRERGRREGGDDGETSTLLATALERSFEQGHSRM